MRRAVITGLGIVSCIGVDKKAVEESLRKGTSGISKSLDYEEHAVSYTHLRAHETG